jgi:hypothetical protein
VEYLIQSVQILDLYNEWMYSSGELISPSALLKFCRYLVFHVHILQAGYKSILGKLLKLQVPQYIIHKVRHISLSLILLYVHHTQNCLE